MLITSKSFVLYTFPNPRNVLQLFLSYAEDYRFKYSVYFDTSNLSFTPLPVAIHSFYGIHRMQNGCHQGYLFPIKLAAI